MALRLKSSKSLDPEKVETLFDQTIRKIKENPRVALCIIASFFILGVTFWGYNKYTSSQDEQAIYAYHVLVKNFPDSKKDRDNWERAVVNFLSNYDNHHLSMLVRLDLIRSDVENGNWERAIKEAEAGIHKLPISHPLRVFFLRYLAIAYTGQNRLDKALYYWNELVRLAPEEWKREIYWKIGLILESEGKIEDAKISWQEALKAKGIFPTDNLIKERINAGTGKSASLIPSGS